MLIIPAIDIINGKVVRLEKGDFNKPTSYQLDPVEAAKLWEGQGAKLLHIVDLDGAKEGKIKNADTIVKIIKNIKVPCEVGGGIREIKDIDYFLENGAMRVVLGTKVIRDQDFFNDIVKKFGDKIVVSTDFKKSGDQYYITTAGWVKKTGITVDFFIENIKEAKLKTIIVTDISRDGTLQGPNIEKLEQILASIDINVIASGGVSSLEDIKRLKAIKNKNLEGVIVGKALYENKIDLKEAIELC
ncbi:MAG: 1-(5-phosphoribosyl)-5-[(5-phosphoribosylamino)methylideneamino]imidazole-4-carboxamide isomerase [Candidatus Omnitrophica bacterium CG_4_9_14_0_2_um_filter_42_8]|nr:MAG: 1-(5-phosphoribosyl)-5-[(5-phosphoribosylamino)methylideneamino]imidazole-4-carboxamide isomerase [Candidatus Omnitrophica bacterium CG22_combo_CG10-13_8_21_14_all_43_16]PJC47990.1 MAG: 1-(5-phosphoribosyl)-5-[(5-phosphoribosylamino)methylideneamino]imidazole-4-carboxamide isomerase [Candidatus Omnitrophica bacterium CG_4_9_14_0_2_um_filter_42_8]